MPLLLALRRDLRLVRPVVELHLRDARDLADLAQVELDLVEVLGEVDRFEQIDLPRRPCDSSDRATPSSSSGSSSGSGLDLSGSPGSAASAPFSARLGAGVGSPSTRSASSSLDSTTGASVETCSPSRRRMTITPCVERPDALDVVDRHADDRAAGRDQHHLVAVADDARAGELAPAPRSAAPSSRPCRRGP